MDYVPAVLALVVGVLVGAAWMRRSCQARVDALAGEREELQRRAERVTVEYETWKASAEQARATEEQLREQSKGAFAAVAQQALQATTAHLLTVGQQADEARKAALTEMLKPFREQLVKLDEGTRQLEVKREKAYVALQEQLRGLETSTQALRVQSEALRTALRSDTRARGRWGEVALRNLVEYAGMTEHCDFDEQETTAGGGRPDLIINLPGGEGRIPIDAKVPMDAYMAGVECDDPETRRAHFARHAEALRNHVRALEKREYAAALGTRVDFTVMFVPADPVLSAAHESRPDLQQEAMERGVLVATPVTLLALLRTVALYWRQSEMARNAQEFWETAREFHKRVTVFAEHFAGVGKGLKSALESFDKAVGSYESRVLPQARRLEELDGPGGPAQLLPEVTPLSRVPSDLPVADPPPRS
jgi:DNA recombination protein RmuC